MGAGALRIKLSTALAAIGLSPILAAPAAAYEVEARSKANELRLQVETGASVRARLVASPSWIVAGEPRVIATRPVEISIPFAVADVPVGTAGQLKVGIIALDGAGAEILRRDRLVPLIVREEAPAEQRSFDVDPCCLEATGLQEVSGEAAEPAFLGGVPNPFVRETSIVFRLPPGGAAVELSIYDLPGRVVHRLSTPHLEGGFHRIRWDGRFPTGEVAPSGIYFCVLSARDWRETRKLIRIR